MKRRGVDTWTMPYDKRRSPILDVREGYGEWVRTYEQQQKPKWEAYAGLPISVAMLRRER